MIIQSLNLESFNYLLCVAFFFSPPSSPHAESRGQIQVPLLIYLLQLLVSIPPRTKIKVLENWDDPHYFSLVSNLMQAYKSQHLLLSAAEASKWPGPSAKEADQTLKYFPSLAQCG